MIAATLLGNLRASDLYDRNEEEDFRAKSPKDQLLLVERIGVCHQDESRKAFWYGRAFIEAYELLHKFDTSLVRDKVDRANSEDIRKLYYDALRANGMGFSEAKEKASRIVVD
jgi:hypothetical protein